MTLYDYTYSISGSFPSGSVASDRLEKEIRDSSITKALSHIDTAGDDCDIWFKALLTTGSNSEKETLDGLVAVHSGQPLMVKTINTSSQGSVVFSLEKRQKDEAPLVALQGRIGSETIYATHNFCDETTWYNGSVRVTSASLVQSGSIWYHSGVGFGTPWIDMYHGKVYDEEGLAEDQFIFASANGEVGHGYTVHVLVDGTEKQQRAAFHASGGEYTVNYASGAIMPVSGQNWSGSNVVACFSHRNSSAWYLEPLPNKTLVLEKAEVQFSHDLEFNSSFLMTTEGYAAVFAPHLIQSNGGPLPDNARIPIDKTQYKTPDQVIDEAIMAFPQVPPISTNTNRGFKFPRNIFQFHYGAVKKLYSSLGMRIGISVENDQPWGGERATATFYCISETDPGQLEALAILGLI